MSEILKGFFIGMEEFAKTMKEHAEVTESRSVGQQELIERVTDLTGRVEKLVLLLEERLGTSFDKQAYKGKRMMDIKERIVENVSRHPEGIRPPELARLLGTKVQNLYPHLKNAIDNQTLVRDNSGTYFPAGDGKAVKQTVDRRL